MPLSLVPQSEPSEVEKVAQRVRRMVRPDGLLQCNRCGGRTVLNTENGTQIKNGRRLRGTKIDTDECADCWKQGIHSAMLPVIKPA